MGGKVSVTRGSMCQAADLDLIRDRNDNIIMYHDGDVYIMMKCNIQLPVHLLRKMITFSNYIERFEMCSDILQTM